MNSRLILSCVDVYTFINIYCLILSILLLYNFDCCGYLLCDNQTSEEGCGFMNLEVL